MDKPLSNCRNETPRLLPVAVFNIRGIFNRIYDVDFIHITDVLNGYTLGVSLRACLIAICPASSQRSTGFSTPGRVNTYRSALDAEPQKTSRQFFGARLRKLIRIGKMLESVIKFSQTAKVKSSHVSHYAYLSKICKTIS